MNRRGFFGLVGKAAVATPFVVTRIGKPEIAVIVEDGVAVLKPGDYRSLVVDNCTFNPLEGQDAIRITNMTARVRNAYGLFMESTNITDLDGEEEK